MGHALIVEDDADASKMLAALVAREGHTVASASSLRDARRLLAMQPANLLLLDLHLPDGNGMELFDDPALLADTEVVLITGQASLETSIEALRLGAADYLLKPVNTTHLKSLLARLCQPSRLRAELDHLNDRWRDTGKFGALIGTSPAMQRVYQQVSRVAGTAVSVFVHGESGTGKELVARAVHDLSRRRDAPFLAVNCGAISPNLMESEIFGHERGSFTGAERQHLGFFERAKGGTLFLDEVTEMPLNLQVKLLRVLESSTFMRVGSTQLQQTDVRIIAATNRDAESAVARGELREDLYYRLNVFPIGLPPLRERMEDVPLLVNSFLDDMASSERTAKRLTEQAMRSLMAWPWRGNVRELRNAIQRAWVMAPGTEIDEAWLPRHPGGLARSSVEQPPARVEQDIGDRTGIGERSVDREGTAAAGDAADSMQIKVGTRLDDVERQVILATYQLCGGQKEQTAAMLGVSMKTLYNRLKEYSGAAPSSRLD